MKRVFFNIIFMIYLVIAIFVTVCLLSYNDYKVSEFGTVSFVIVPDNKLNPDFNKGDLAIIDKADGLEVGDKFLYYDVYNEQVMIRLGTINDIDDSNEFDVKYLIDDGEYEISDEYVIGPASTATIMPNVGTVLGIIESRWGFLFLIVLPALIAFVNQIMVVATGIKQAKKEIKEEAKEDKKETKGKEAND